MFTINIYLKLAIIAVSLIGGVVLTFTMGFWYAFPFYLIGLGFLATYILLGTVQSAAQMMESMDFVGTEKRLAMTLKPNWLYVTNRAFYSIIKGTLAMNIKDMDGAEKWFENARSLKLPSDNERAMVWLQLANIHASRNKWNQARNLFNQVKKFKVTEQQILDQVKEFEKAFKNRGQLKHARSGAMYAGGKRRRPKMR